VWPVYTSQTAGMTKATIPGNARKAMSARVNMSLETVDNAVVRIVVDLTSVQRSDSVYFL